MKHLNFAKWMAALGCLCGGGQISPANATSIKPDQVAFVSELDIGRANRSQETRHSITLGTGNASTEIHGRWDRPLNLRLEPLLRFDGEPSRGRSGRISEGPENGKPAVLGSASPGNSVGNSTKKPERPNHPGKPGNPGHPGNPVTPKPRDGVDPTPINVADRGFTLGLLGLAMSSIALFHWKATRTSPAKMS